VSFIFIEKTDMSEVRNHLETRFANAKTIPGTKDFHHFISENESAHTVSSDNENFPFTVHFKNSFF
jgi:hypothetical protein